MNGDYLEGRADGFEHIRLQLRSKEERSLFAAACAERLVAAVDKARGDAPTTWLQEARTCLDLAWMVAAGQTRVTEAHILSRVSELHEMMPDEDAESWTASVAYKSNTLACVAYALRCSATGNLEDVMWAAGQLYEAADFAAQSLAARHEYRDGAEELATVLGEGGLESLLALARAGDATTLRATAQVAGRRFARFVS